MPTRSMTGFARARRANGAGEIVVTVKSVNHRALDLHVYAPSDFDPYEPALRSLVKANLVRGHVDIRVSFTPAAGTEGPSLNKGLFESYLKAVQEAAGFGVEAKTDVNAALRIPGMFSANSENEPSAELESLLLDAAKEALESLREFRTREGSAIAGQLKEINAKIRADAAVIHAERGVAVDFLRKRLEERLAELLQGVSLEPQRLAQEVAVLADRSDIAEELSRLDLHSRELDLLLDKGGELGKKLDFLLQEMNRETNTMLSKTSGAGEPALKITASALDIKANIERIREQALNLE